MMQSEFQGRNFEYSSGEKNTEKQDYMVITVLADVWLSLCESAGNLKFFFCCYCFWDFLPDEFEIMENEHWKHRAYLGEEYEKYVNTQTVNWLWIKE